jgi:REP element-mobilizing transposase RayT
MARPRKHHVQTELAWRTWGGRREGAGRPRTGCAGEPHLPRPLVKRAHPLHVTMRVTPEVGSMRRQQAYAVIRHALGCVAAREGVRIVHISIQANHLHLVVEADDRRALARGMAAFTVAAARRFNQVLGRRGQVFLDRYHVETITSPRHARHTLAYVLNNFRHHEEDRWAQRDDFTVDPYASSVGFDGWRDPARVPAAHPLGYPPLPVSRPTAWLLTTGWRRHGLLDVFETPGPAGRAWGGPRTRRQRPRT